MSSLRLLGKSANIWEFSSVNCTQRFFFWWKTDYFFTVCFVTSVSLHFLVRLFYWMCNISPPFRGIHIVCKHIELLIKTQKELQSKILLNVILCLKNLIYFDFLRIVARMQQVFGIKVKRCIVMLNFGILLLKVRGYQIAFWSFKNSGSFWCGDYAF